jgi:hypothetical protein
MKTAGNIELYIIPLVTVGINRRQQPFKTRVALYGHDNATGLTTGKSIQVMLSLVQPRQHFVSELQQPIAGAREPHRSSLTQE